MLSLGIPAVLELETRGKFSRMITTRRSRTRYVLSPFLCGQILNTISSIVSHYTKRIHCMCACQYMKQEEKPIKPAGIFCYLSGSPNTAVEKLAASRLYRQTARAFGVSTTNKPHHRRRHPPAYRERGHGGR